MTKLEICKGCGNCCEGVTPNLIADRQEKPAKFKKAVGLLPAKSLEIKYGSVRIRVNAKTNYCGALTSSRLCLLHGSAKPDMCKGYRPWNTVAHAILLGGRLAPKCLERFKELNLI